MIRKDIITNWQIAQFVFTFLAIFFSGGCQFAYTQLYHTQCPDSIQHDITNKAVIFALNYTPKQPYATKQLYNTWTKGAVIFADGKKADQVMLSYNVWLDELLWINENSYHIGVIPKESILEFVFYNENDLSKEKFRNIKTSETRKKGSFFQVLIEGDFTVYCQYKYTYVPKDREFEKSETFYLQTKGSLQRFTPNRRSILSLFPNDQKHEVRQEIRKNYPWRLNKEELARFFGSFNAP